MRMYLLALLLLVVGVSAANLTFNTTQLVNVNMSLVASDWLNVQDLNANVFCGAAPVQVNASCVANVTQNFSCPALNLTEILPYFANFTIVYFQNQSVNVTPRVNARHDLNYGECTFNYDANETWCAPQHENASSILGGDRLYAAFLCSNVTGQSLVCDPGVKLTPEACAQQFGTGNATRTQPVTLGTCADAFPNDFGKTPDDTWKGILIGVILGIAGAVSGYLYGRKSAPTLKGV